MGGMGCGDDKPSDSSAMFCEHANEVPCSLCTCPPRCYCRAHTCKPPLQTETRRFSYIEPCGQLPRPGLDVTDADFDAHVARTETRADGTVGGLDYCLLKLAAEAGEVAGLRGKEILAGDVVLVPTRRADEHTARLIPVARRARYALELGDVLWYLTEACRLLGLTLDEVKALNIMKLTRRRATNVAGKVIGKDPAGEQFVAEKWLEDPTHGVEMIAAWRAARPPEKPALAGPEYDWCVRCADNTRQRGPAGEHRCVPCGGAR